MLMIYVRKNNYNFEYVDKLLTTFFSYYGFPFSIKVNLSVKASPKNSHLSLLSSPHIYKKFFKQYSFNVGSTICLRANLSNQIFINLPFCKELLFVEKFDRYFFLKNINNLDAFYNLSFINFLISKFHYFNRQGLKFYRIKCVSNIILTIFR